MEQYFCTFVKSHKRAGRRPHSQGSHLSGACGPPLSSKSFSAKPGFTGAVSAVRSISTSQCHPCTPYTGLLLAHESLLNATAMG